MSIFWKVSGAIASLGPVYWALMAAAIAIFAIYPEGDLAVHAYLYREGEGFFLKDALWVKGLYHLVPYLVRGLVIVCLGALGYWAIRRRPLGWLTPMRVAYLLLALALGPGLVVNTLFKDQWGRARPSQVEQFGGEKLFTPPSFRPQAQCERNCSFVSGHASVGFYFAAFAFLLPAYRKRILSASLLFGLTIGVVRMAQGGHFLSDVLFSGLFVYAVCHILYQAMFGGWFRKSESSEIPA